MMVLNGFEALGTKWYVEIYDGYEDALMIESHKKNLEEVLLSFNASYSRFRGDSLVGELNKYRRTRRDTHLEKMIGIGTDANIRTQGIFTMMHGRELSEKGYGEVTEKVEHEDYSSVEIGDNEITLSGNQLLDLGGIGKGYVIDLLAECLQGLQIQYFFINGGGDMYATSNFGEPVTVLLQHPLQHDLSIGSYKLMNQSLCASSSYVRMWKDPHGEYKNHFVSQKGDEVWAASFVVARSACVADMMATVCCLLASECDRLSAIARSFSCTFVVFDETFKQSGNLVFDVPGGLHE
jgi:thiamine biosynthesis lipoprotein